jgi:MerR family copper efflux transcriptional regulator
VGDLARHFQITPQMVHVYTTMGLIKERRRTPAGYRLYAQATLKRLALVRAMNRRGYPLREIARLFLDKQG